MSRGKETWLLRLWTIGEGGRPVGSAANPVQLQVPYRDSTLEEDSSTHPQPQPQHEPEPAHPAEHEPTAARPQAPPQN